MVKQIMTMLKSGLRKTMSYKHLYPVIGFFLIILQSCSLNVTAILQNLLKETDEIKIYLNKKSLEDKNNAVIVINSKDTIQSILNSITDKEAGKRRCEYTGSLEFFHNGVSLMNMEFSLTNECPVVVFQYKGTIFRKIISQEGVQLLKNYVYQIKT